MLYIMMLFLIYSFGGCILEILYCGLLNLRLESRKCMLLSMLCPVYGIGALSVIWTTAPFQKSKIAVFLVGAIAATLAEYVTDFFYKEILHVEFWNYSKQFLNINGRVCLLYTAIWGVLSLALVYWVHPRVSVLVSKIDDRLALFLTLFFVADAILSMYLLRRYETKNAIDLVKLYRGMIS